VHFLFGGGGNRRRLIWLERASPMRRSFIFDGWEAAAETAADLQLNAKNLSHSVRLIKP
jgi:hypothetical protein